MLWRLSAAWPRQAIFGEAPSLQAHAAGKDGVTNPDQSCQYCKDMGHLLENCVRLEARQQFLANQEKLKEGLN